MRFDHCTHGLATAALVAAALAGTPRAQVEEQVLLDPLGGAFDRFGHAVAIDSSQNLIVVGAPTDVIAVNRLSEVLVFRRFGLGSWFLEQTLTSGVPGDQFGYSVAVDGDVIVVGARHGSAGPAGLPDTGAAYVFRYSNFTSSWALEQQLVAFDGQPGDSFGFSVAVEGNVAVIGAPQRDFGPGPTLMPDVGAAYVFERPPTGAGWIYTAMLTPYDPAIDDWLGYGVAISGSWVAASAPIKANSRGAVYLGTYAGGVLTPYVPALRASDGAAFDGFGEGLDLDGSTLVAGAPDDEPSMIEVNRGAAYVFDLRAGSWVEVQKLTASSACDSDWFGQSVSIRGDVIAIGAPGCDDPTGVAMDSGATYVFRDHGLTWVEEHKCFASMPGPVDKLGTSIATNGEVVVAGGPTQSGLGQHSGAAWVFRDAYWVNYGSGWPGTLGVPGLTLGADPIQASNVPIVIGNSRGQSTPAALLIGPAPAAWPTPFGGTLLVMIAGDVPIPLPPGGITILAPCPTGTGTSGLQFYLQVLELDPGASHGISFSRGLELGFGQF